MQRVKRPARFNISHVTTRAKTVLKGAKHKSQIQAVINENDSSRGHMIGVSYRMDDTITGFKEMKALAALDRDSSEDAAAINEILNEVDPGKPLKSKERGDWARYDTLQGQYSKAVGTAAVIAVIGDELTPDTITAGAAKLQKITDDDDNYDQLKDHKAIESGLGALRIVATKLEAHTALAVMDMGLDNDTTLDTLKKLEWG